MFPAPLFPAGPNVFVNWYRASVSADFDGDGVLDVAVNNEAEDTISVLQGLGDGTLAEPEAMGAGDRPVGLVAADFDADGAIDLAVANRGSDDIYVFAGHGDGSFAAPVVIPVGDGPRPLACADVDADGVLDLVVGNGLGSSTTVLLGTGSGTFISTTTIVTGREPSDIAIADLNGDGRLDLVVTNEQDSNMAVLLGQAGGSFAAPVKYPTESGPSAVAIANLDADLVPDVAIAIGAVANHGLFVRHGLGDGSLGPPVDVGGKMALDVIATDVDADSDADLLLANWSGYIQVFRNDRVGEVVPSAIIPAGQRPRGLSLGDFDADGVLDLVAVLDDWDDVVVLRGLEAGTFDHSDTVPCGGGFPFDMRLGDADLDGNIDVVTVGESPNSIRVLRASADGTFAAPIITPIAKAGRALSLGDVNGDSVLDAAVAAPADGSVQIHLGAGNGTFVPGQNLAVPQPGSCLLVDLDDDGDVDLATTSQSTDSLRLYLNSGTGSFSLLASTAVGDQPVGIDAGDLNGDGHVDIVVANSNSSSLSMILAVGPGVFAPPITLASAGYDQVFLMDLDEDGKLDLAVNGTGLPVHWGNGDGSFSSPIVTNPDIGPVTDNPVLADLDGDGLNDLAVVWGQRVSVLSGQRAGRFGQLRQFAIANGGGPLAAIDFDADQAMDLVTTGTVEFAGVVTVMFNRASMPWIELGGGVAGAAGMPHLGGLGPLVPGSAFTLTLSSAASATVSALVAGLSAINAPFKGGVMVPALDVVLFGLPTGASGGYALSSTWPVVLPTGFQVYLQAWIVDPTGPVGLAASNALVATTN